MTEPEQVPCTYETLHDSGSAPGWSFLAYDREGYQVDGAALVCDVHGQVAGHPVYETLSLLPFNSASGPCQWYEDDFIDAWGRAWREQTYTLPEQRILITVRGGGRGAIHVVEYRTYPASSHPGRWTRRASDRRAFCGGLKAAMTGIDAKDWPTERIAPEHLDWVTCKRCRAAAARRLRED